MVKRMAGTFNRLSLRSKLAITHLIIIIVPMVVVGVFFYTSLYEMIVSDTIRKEQTASTKTVPLVEKAVADIQEADKRLESLIRETVVMARSPDSAEPVTQNSVDQMEKELDYLASNQMIAGIRIYMDDETIDRLAEGGIRSSIFTSARDTKGTYWHGIFAGSPSMHELWCPAFYLSSSEITSLADMAHITKNSLETEGGRADYFIAIYFHKQTLEELLHNNLSSSANVAYLINERDNLAASTNDSLSAIYHFDYDEIRQNVSASKNFIERSILGETVYAAFYHVSGTDWYMAVAMPATPLEKKSSFIVLGFFIIYMICLVIALGIALAMSASITNRLSGVIRQMSLVRLGPPSPMPEPATKDEIGDLVDSYNYMSRMIVELMETQAKNAEELRRAEFNSLQAQINPHFLYNTMDMISWLAQKGEPDQVTRAVQRLSRFYRLTLGQKSALSTIGKELEHASIYISLQNMRFDGSIELINDVSDTLFECPIPKLTLQPIVENCILHGIMEKPDKNGTIVINGWLEDEAVVLLIFDDGIGMDDEKVKGLLKPQAGREDGSNIAIYNIHRRLQLLFGSDYGLMYRSTPMEGTEVEIRLPRSADK